MHGLGHRAPTGIYYKEILLVAWTESVIAMLDAYAPHALTVSAIFPAVVREWRKPELPYPPGLKGHPITGNILDVPRGVPTWEGFASMAHKYGVHWLNNTTCR